MRSALLSFVPTSGDTPHQLIGMWESGKNLQERPLSQFEAQAVAEAWCRVFGELPPDCGEDGEPDPPPEPRADRVMRARGKGLA